MKRNFEFEVITVVRWGERFIDLHNAYDIDGFGTDLGGSEVRLSFVRNEYALDLELPSKVALVCSGNVKIAFNDLGLLAAPLNDEGIQIAYFNDACDWLSLLDEDTARSHPRRGCTSTLSMVSRFVSFATRLRSRPCETTVVRNGWKADISSCERGR